MVQAQGGLGTDFRNEPLDRHTGIDHIVTRLSRSLRMRSALLLNFRPDLPNRLRNPSIRSRPPRSRAPRLPESSSLQIAKIGHAPSPVSSTDQLSCHLAAGQRFSLVTVKRFELSVRDTIRLRVVKADAFDRERRTTLHKRRGQNATSLMVG